MSRPIAISKNRKIEYVLESQRKDKPEDQIRWKLRVLPFAVRTDIMSSISYDSDGNGATPRAVMDVGRRYLLACRFGLAGWEGPFEDDAGSAIEPQFNAHKRNGLDVLSDECLAQIPDDVIIELGSEIIELSSTGAGAVGKRESQHTLQQET